MRNQWRGGERVGDVVEEVLQAVGVGEVSLDHGVHVAGDFFAGRGIVEVARGEGDKFGFAGEADVGKLREENGGCGRAAQLSRARRGRSCG